MPIVTGYIEPIRPDPAQLRGEVMVLKEHRFYAYYQGNRIFARMEDQKPVLAETCDSAQAAHDRVQQIKAAGFEAYVRAAYGRHGRGK